MHEVVTKWVQPSRINIIILEAVTQMGGALKHNPSEVAIEGGGGLRFMSTSRYDVPAASLALMHRQIDPSTI